MYQTKAPPCVFANVLKIPRYTFTNNSTTGKAASVCGITGLDYL